MAPGYIAALTFIIFTGSGYFAQVIKLVQRRRSFLQGRLDRAQVCDGLHPTREIISFAAFTLFALSGITRSYLDLFLFGSRVPVVILTLIIIWFLYRFGNAPAKNFFIGAVCGAVISCGLVTAAFCGVQLYATPVAYFVDAAVSVSGFLVFYGKVLQARLIYKANSAGAVSLFRETGLLIKDLSGLWYASTVGAELFWVGLTHSLSGIASLLVVLATVRAKRASLKTRSEP